MGAKFEDVKRIEPYGLANRFAERCQNSPDQPFAFLLGAGASVSRRPGCHIKHARQMVNDWLLRLHRDAVGDTDLERALEWATPETLGIPSYNPKDPAASYADIYARAYASDPREAHGYLRREIDGKSPDLGYYVLAQVLSKGPSRTLLTTNFDNHAVDALSAISSQYPLVIGHELLAEYADEQPRRPTIIKLHRDLLYGPKNAPDETRALDPGLTRLVTRVCTTHPMIVVGYGGNDGSLMGVLQGLKPDAFPGGLYWCWYPQGGPLREAIVEFIHAQDGFIVPIKGFNDLMILFSHALELDSLAGAIQERGRQRLKIVDEGMKMLPPSTYVEEVIPSTISSDTAVERAKLWFVRQASQDNDDQTSWWEWELDASTANPEDRESVYQRALNSSLSTLKELDRDNAPAKWATLQEQVGLIRLRLAKGSDVGSLQEAISAFRLAQNVFTRFEFPARWASIQNNVALALTELGKQGIFAARREAIEASRESLATRNRATDPVAWALTLNNLGNALKAMGEAEDPRALSEAVDCYTRALEVLTRETAPTDWARLQTNLGNALTALGERGNSTALEQATVAFGDALEVRTRETDPEGWAITNFNLGKAERIRGERGNPGALARGLAAYDAALDVITRQANPTVWAMIQINRGYVLLALAEYGRAAAVDEAVAASRLALEVVGRPSAPALWAESQHALGSALTKRAESGDSGAFVEAQDAYRLALEVRNLGAHPLGWAITYAGIGNLLLITGTSGDAQALLQSANCFREALKIVTRDAHPVYWAGLQLSLANALRILGELGSLEYIQDSLLSFRLALEVVTLETAPAYYAKVQQHLGLSLLLQAKASGGTAWARQALKAFDQAELGYAAAGLPGFVEWAAPKRKEAQDVVAGSRPE